MMIDPESYKKINEEKGLLELIEERNKILKEISEFEEKHVFNYTPYTDEELVKPGPDTIYLMNHYYLIAITELIIEFEKRSKRKFTYEESEITFENEKE